LNFKVYVEVRSAGICQPPFIDVNGMAIKRRIQATAEDVRHARDTARCRKAADEYAWPAPRRRRPAAKTPVI